MSERGRHRVPSRTRIPSALPARVVGPSGKVYSQSGEMPAEEAWKGRLKEPGMSAIVQLQKPFTSPGDILPVPLSSLDAVICNMNYHDMIGDRYDTARINAVVFNSLKPGGIYGIIDNSAAPDSGARDVSTLHRVDEAYEVNQIKSAGFVLQAASDACAIPRTTARGWCSSIGGSTTRHRFAVTRWRSGVNSNCRFRFGGMFGQKRDPLTLAALPILFRLLASLLPRGQPELVARLPLISSNLRLRNFRRRSRGETLRRRYGYRLARSCGRPPRSASRTGG